MKLLRSYFLKIKRTTGIDPPPVRDIRDAPSVRDRLILALGVGRLLGRRRIGGARVGTTLRRSILLITATGQRERADNKSSGAEHTSDHLHFFVTFLCGLLSRCLCILSHNLTDLARGFFLKLKNLSFLSGPHRSQHRDNPFKTLAFPHEQDAS